MSSDAYPWDPASFCGPGAFVRGANRKGGWWGAMGMSDPEGQENDAEEDAGPSNTNDGARHGARQGAGQQAGGPFGQGGPFGPSGVFGPGGPFGPGGLFGGRPGRPGPARAKRGDVRAAALLLLAEGPMNGYQIIQSLQDRTGGVWRPSPGAVYPALAQLEDEGLIEAFDLDGRRSFRLTQAGLADVAAWGDRPKPWAFAQDEAERSMGGGSGVWVALGQLGMAAHAVSQAGDPAATKAAVTTLTEARRALYRLLAGGSSGGTDETPGNTTDPSNSEAPHHERSAGSSPSDRPGASADPGHAPRDADQD